MPLVVDALLGEEDVQSIDVEFENAVVSGHDSCTTLRKESGGVVD